jgi:putative serine protease PepD
VAEHRRGVVTILAAAGIALVAGVTGGLVGRATAGAGPVAPACPAAAIAERVLPSVVTLAVGGGNGSGEVIRDGGYILTNDHVIAPAGSPGAVTVLFSDGTSAPATIVGRAPRVDLAVVRAAATGPLPLIALGKSSELRVGEPVVALGAPLGLSGTVTAGIVSALGRDIPVADTVLPGAVQTDASINPGNSGGPLVDARGRVVGINTAMIGRAQGLCFAIGVDTAVDVTARLMRDGRVKRAKLGLAGQTTMLDSRLARRLGRMQETAVLVMEVQGGSAERGGLRQGDLVLEFDGQPVFTVDDLHRLLTSEAADRDVAVSVLRQAKIEALTLRPESDG